MAKTKITLDDLAGMVNRRFDESDKNVNSRFKTMIDRFEKVEADVHDIRMTLGPLVGIFTQQERKINKIDLRLRQVEREVGIKE